jgi:hypothetical protein
MDRDWPDTEVAETRFLFGSTRADSIQRQAPTIQASFPQLRLSVACRNCPGFIGSPSKVTEQSAFEPYLFIANRGASRPVKLEAA